MIHQERIAAIQKDLPIPPPLDPGTVTRPKEPSATAVEWFRMVSLALGLFFLFAGVGMCAGFLVLEDFRDIWALGMIPAMAGLGFLLFYGLSRDIASSLGQQGGAVDD